MNKCCGNSSLPRYQRSQLYIAHNINMNTKEKVVLGAGACVLTGLICYCAYKYYETRKSIPKETEESELGDDCKSVSDEEAKIPLYESVSDEEAKIPLYDLMDNVLVEGISNLLSTAKNLQEAKIQQEYKPETLSQLEAYVEKQFDEVEVKVCEENDWNINEYTDEVERRQDNNDQEVIRRINMMGDVIKDVLSDRRPKVEFKFDSNLTPESTLILYAWIVLTHGYSYCKELRRAVAKGDDLNMNNEELDKMITKAVDKTRASRR